MGIQFLRETEFLYQSKRIDPIAGRTLIWPPGFTHKHRGNPPLKGEKIYMTGWLNIAPIHEDHGRLTNIKHC